MNVFKLKKSGVKTYSADDEVEGKDLGVKFVHTYDNTINFEPDDFSAGDRGSYWVRITGGGFHEGDLVELY